MTAYLPPIEKPKGLLIKAVYRIARRMFGKVPAAPRLIRRF